MAELLTSLDVVNRQFKKNFRGYDPADVDEFLDRVAESIQAYVQKTKDLERSLDEQTEKLGDYENIKNSLHEALLMAQRTAEEKVANAGRSAEEKMRDASNKADDIIAEAKLKAERMIQEAEANVARYADELQALIDLRTAGLEQVRELVGEIESVLDRARSGGRIEMPEFAQRAQRRRDAAPQHHAAAAPAAQQQEPPILVEHHHAEFLTASADDLAEEEKMNQISDTLNALGIDPGLLNTGV